MILTRFSCKNHENIIKYAIDGGIKVDTINEVKKQQEYIEKVKKINEGKLLKYNILTMGCQLNENDSEKICGMLEEMGYTKTDDFHDADLNLFNTCCVRENAEDKLFGKLGELKKLKEEKGIIIAIGGCMMQEKHITDKIKNHIHLLIYYLEHIHYIDFQKIYIKLFVRKRNKKIY